MGQAAPGELPIGRWLVDLGIQVLERGERDGVHSWDIVLHGRRRRDIRATVILQPAVACVLWVHYAPPLGDSFRKTYRQLLHWNDELPFAKFALGADERLVLATELAPGGLDRDTLGLALARLTAICDLLRDESATWIWPGGATTSAVVGRPSAVLERYAEALGDLAMGPDPGS
ncbi:MAG TPA: YbjN domain-containing protein [Candidatus Baltobacteraceae bacterium]|nr:YbjN domain-containing protein [Candidatus Baltobacteraceae bacterium]